MEEHGEKVLAVIEIVDGIILLPYIWVGYSRERGVEWTIGWINRTIEYMWVEGVLDDSDDFDLGV